MPKWCDACRRGGATPSSTEADEDLPTLRAVEERIRTLQDPPGPAVELARGLAVRFDRGETFAAAQLRQVLAQLERHVRPSGESDLDRIRRKREERRAAAIAAKLQVPPADQGGA